MKLKHIEDAGQGRLRYRRRFPKAVAEETGKVFFKMTLGALSGDALARAWSQADAAFGVAIKASERRTAQATRSGPLEQAENFKRQAAELLAGVVGVGPILDRNGHELMSAEDQAREVLAEVLVADGADPRLYRAVVLPGDPPPAATLKDAVNLYVNDKLAGGEGVAEKKEVQRIDRVFRRIAKAVGPLDKLAIIELRHKHGTLTVDSFLQEKTKTGKLLSLASIKREMNIAKAVVNYAIRGFDLENAAKNPFVKVPIARKGAGGPVAEGELRKALPASVIEAMPKGLRKEDHRLIWRLLVGTGCRLAEITGLTVDDIDIAANIPHIRVRWNENRRLKTVVSIRSVPLVGDALEAAREAMKLPRTDNGVFPRYAREGGPGAASQALMGYLRGVTTNPKHVIHSLRHNMRARLERAKAPETVINLILGHALGGVGARVYGGDRLHLTAEAMEAALKIPVQ